jgi:hypothetical protein
MKCLFFLVTDATLYMKEALEELSVKSHKLINVACVAHVLNTIGDQFMRFVQL